LVALIPPHEVVCNVAVLFGLALTAAVVLAHRRAPLWWVGLISAWPVFEGIRLLQAFRAAPGLDSRDVSLVRGVVAAVAAVALLRERFSPPRFPVHRAVFFGVLGLCGLLGFAAFFNLGYKQFRNEQQKKWTYVHYLDHRQYYATAKYFRELGYRGIYRADIAAYLEDSGASRDSVAALSMRNLDTHLMSTVGAQWPQIEAVRSRFSPERWESYKRDARYLREAMGQKMYFDYMVDFGGNATPVWIGTASLLYNRAPASDRFLFVTALLDPLLLLIAFAAIWRCFGPRTMLVCMTVFGANDFIMYGSNWAGATLRHDWMAYIALGVCALKRERWMLGGVLLALAAMIRAFPALAVASLALPSLWGIWNFRAEKGRLPTFFEFRGANRDLERAWFGAVAVVVVLFLVTSLTFSFGAWEDWWNKVGLLTADPHGNHISLRSLIGGWEDNQWRVLRARLPLYLAAVAGFVALVVAAARGKRRDQAAVLGLILIPVLFYPANYYIHFVWLLPLLMTETSEGVADICVPLSMLLLCAAQYFTVPVTPFGIHFYLATVLLFIALSALLAGVLYGDVRAGAWKGAAEWLRRKV
jgi:hypothetical protein